MSKENLKDNLVEAPTLFVGVGGTGSSIVKMVAEMCRPGEIENINFVCLDTNVNDLSNVSGSNAHIYCVQTSNTQTVGNYLDYDKDALKNWFPKNAVLYDKTVSEGAGQVRAISRLALNSTIKTGHIRPLIDAIDDLFRKSGKEMKQAMRCVVVSTASGGTGSGIVLPLSMYIRDYVNNKYPNTSLIVRSLILLPETLDSVIDSTVERESQRRNAYATIKEMNAFMMQGSGFFDINDELKRYRNMHIDFSIPGSDELKSLALLPADFCFLMDGQNAEDSTLVNLTQYKIQAAQALYEQNIGPMQKKAFSVEDNIIKEMSNPGNFGRNRFGGIGAGVIRYPYEEIADYIAYNWAMESIGGEGEAAKWAKYDNAFEVKSREERKKGLAYSEMKKRSDVYISTMNSAGDSFSKDLRSKYLQNASKRVSTYFNALAEQMHSALGENTMIRATRDAANELAEEIDYKADETKRGHARENLSLLRDYETAVRQNAQKIAEGVAEAIFMNETKTINEKKNYTLEALLKNPFGDVCHPNAARYMLYLVKNEMVKRVSATQNRINDVIQPTLELYSSEANDANTFDFKGTRKVHERSIDDLVKAEKDDPNLFEKLGGSDKIYELLNACFTDYHSAITDLGNLTAELEAYKLGAEYVDELCKMYERFYRTFGDKVTALVRRQEEIVDHLAFTKGDSVMNVCASKALLEELAKSTRAAGEEGSMLDSELNGQIFDAIKSNVVFEREIRAADIIENDRRVDIFDEILLGYFRNSVRSNCETIDLNIIEAIAMENRLRARIKMREKQQGKGEKLFDKVTADENLRYIRKIIAMGERLAAPGIQRVTNEEPREVKLCAYNRSLCDMRAYRVADLLPKGDAVETISRYELHFFNALYNLTPDKLNKFASPAKTETGAKSAGLYHNAYTSYSKHIGPDSTKNMMISTHIDKRWDSIAAMPELDFDYQRARMLKIHKAMIYALVHGAISYKNLSAASMGKMVYKYENSDERTVEMIVSNGTPCDEFFEILDALYLSSAMVEDIGTIKERKRTRNLVKNSNYEDTNFANDLKEFNIPTVHEGRTSLFEIPLAYYNSLPNSQRFVSEISALVNAVVEVLREELSIWEKSVDAKFVLCVQLKEQFELLIRNYKEYETLNCGTNVNDNPVISMIYRTIKNIINDTPEPDDFETTLAELKALLN